jgi:protein ImuA
LRVAAKLFSIFVARIYYYQLSTDKAHIIAQLQKDILLRQGFKPASSNHVSDMGLGAINNAFPDGVFPTGAVHEFLTADREQLAATSGFIAGITGKLMQHGGACIWVSNAATVFPPALKAFGIAPERVIFVTLQREKDLLWAMEEALKCEGLAAVVGEIRDLSFTASRRLQLAVEQSSVTGFILRHQPRSVNVIASVSRWRITPLASTIDSAALPGVGFARWNVSLLKIRNGKTGEWQVEWVDGCFRQPSKPVFSIGLRQMGKTG